MVTTANLALKSQFNFVLGFYDIDYGTKSIGYSAIYTHYIQNFWKMNNMGLLITGSEFSEKLSSARKIIDKGSSAHLNFSRSIAHMLTIRALRFGTFFFNFEFRLHTCVG